MSSPLGHHGDEMDHLAFLQEPMSDEEDDELDVENIQKSTSSSSQLSAASAVNESQNTSLFKEEQKVKTTAGWLTHHLLGSVLYMFSNVLLYFALLSVSMIMRCVLLCWKIIKGISVTVLKFLWNVKCVFKCLRFRKSENAL